MPELTTAQFATALPLLRADLLRIIQSIQKRSTEDAEDILSEVTLLALNLLPRYKTLPNEPLLPYPPSLLRWLKGIARYAILNERSRTSRRPVTVPIDAASNIPAPPYRAPETSSLLPAVGELPPKLRTLVNLWCEGHSQSDITRLTGLAYNTVGNRLELAYQILRVAMPDSDEIDYDLLRSDFSIGSRVAVYRRPVGVWKSWFAQHPPDKRLTTHRRRAARERKQRTERPSVYARREARRKKGKP